jgi:ankyrin repeat protein
MKWYSGSVAAVAVSLTVLPCCKRRGEAEKTDLRDAGYKITTDDWFRASRDNDVAALKKFVAAKFPADTRNVAGDSALHAAAGGGAEGAADFLLDLKLPVDLRGASQRTPLMVAVMADQTAMVRWLLRQGADPRLKDHQGFKPLMLAVRDGHAGVVGDLAASNREDLDSALLLAALVGRASVIDTLTNFGASIHARMEDGRTPLMIAAENGHVESVKLLLDIGASRFTTDPEGRTAADRATAAGHPEIAALLSREPQPGDLTLESPAEIAKSMDAFVDVAVAKSFTRTLQADGSMATTTRRATSIPIQGETLVSRAASRSDGQPATPQLVMRHYREKEVPLRIKTVQGNTATILIAGTPPREVKVQAGGMIPGSNLTVVRVRRRMEDSKVSAGQPAEISVMEVRDTTTGNKREWISGVPSNSHDPVALVEDAATGKRYLASPGQKFKGSDGAEYFISDVRPNQMVIQHVASGTVQTIPLRGPRG